MSAKAKHKIDWKQVNRREDHFLKNGTFKGYSKRKKNSRSIGLIYGLNTVSK